MLWLANVWVLLILAVGAFAVDLGKYLHARAVTRDAIDAAALAASAALESGQNAQTAAALIVNQNSRTGVTIDSSQISVTAGFWNPVTRSFAANGWPTNAVRVTSSQPYNGGVFSSPSTRIEASSIAHFQQRDVVLVLDYSGSMMKGDKYNALKAAVKDFCKEVEEVGNGRDRVAMISYSDLATLQTGFTTDLSRVRNLIDTSVYTGATNIGDGMKMSLDLIQSSGRPAAERMVIVLTDGLANRPTTVDPVQYVKDQANRARGLGVPVYTVSFGSDADQSLMQYVADATSMKHYHINDSTSSRADLCRTFRELAIARGTHFVK